MNDSPYQFTVNPNGNVSISLSGANPDGTREARILTRLLEDYFNCSDCQQVSAQANNSTEANDIWNDVIRARLAMHLRTTAGQGGTDADHI